MIRLCLSQMHLHRVDPELTGQVLGSICKLTNLQTLALWHLPKLTYSDFKTAASFSHLKCLGIKFLEGLKKDLGKTLTVIFDHSPLIDELELYEVPQHSMLTLQFCDLLI